MDPLSVSVSVFAVAESAIGALSAVYKIYKRIEGAYEKIDHAGEEIGLNLSFLEEHFKEPRAELSPEALKRVNTRLENIQVAAEEARDILELWEDSTDLERLVIKVGRHPGVLQDLSDKIDKNMVKLQTEYWGLARGTTGPNNHIAIVPGAPPSEQVGTSTNGGFQPTLPMPIPNHPPQTLFHNQEQRPGSACLGPEPTVPSRPSELRTASGNFNNPESLLSSSAPPSTSTSGGHDPLAHMVTINLNLQLNNQQPIASHSRPPLPHSSTAHPRIPFHQQQNAPLQNTLSPGRQHQRVGDASSYSQPSAQLGVPPPQALQPNNTNPLYSSGNVNGVSAAQIPPSYADVAAVRPPDSQPPRGTSHHPPNIPAQPQNYQNQPPRHQPHLSQTPTQPSRQPQASGWTGRGMPVPPATKRPQGPQMPYMQIPHNARPGRGFGQPLNHPQAVRTGYMPTPAATQQLQPLQQTHMQIPHNAQPGCSFGQLPSQPQAPRTGHVPTPAATKQLQPLQQTHMQIPNNVQSGGGSLQPSNQPQVPGTATSSRPQDLQTAQFPKNGHSQLRGGSVRPAIQPQVPCGTGQIPAISATRRQGLQNTQSSDQNALRGGFTQPAPQPRAPCRTGQMPAASAPRPIPIPQQKQFPNNTPLTAGPTLPQASQSLPNYGLAGIPQHHSGAPTYFPSGMSSNLNPSAQSFVPSRHSKHLLL